MIAKLIAEVAMLARKANPTLSDAYVESLKELDALTLAELRDSYQEELQVQPGWYDFV
jgi:hypothetical protein